MGDTFEYGHEKEARNTENKNEYSLRMAASRGLSYFKIAGMRGFVLTAELQRRTSLARSAKP
jgi:hypothetical protein